MLFRRNIEPCCAYCAHGSAVSETESRCEKHGVTDIGFHCSAFKYDPLRREPPKPILLNTSKLSAEDFSID